MDLAIRFSLARIYSIDADEGKLRRDSLILLGVASSCPGTQQRADCMYKKKVARNLKKERVAPLY